MLDEKSSFYSEPGGRPFAESISYKTEDLPLPVTAIRYYLALEICAEGTKVYHYCCCLYPGYHVWPVGYCSSNCAGHP